MSISLNLQKLLFFIAALFCLMPWISAPLALVLGLIFAQLSDHPYPDLGRKATQWLLKFSVTGLGFGMNIFSALQAGKEGVLFSIAAIAAVLVLGYLLGKIFRTERKTSFLIAAGTAICGGSAIAALAPVMRAGEKEVSVSLGIIFVLNSAALFIFPAIGHVLNLSQTQFGMWCAIAIHDTSSVVGAASRYGEQALQVATTVKLARALWIVPLALGTAFFFNDGKSQLKMPWFIGLFILAMLANTYLPFIRQFAPYMVSLAKKGLSLTLFLIGSGLSLKVVSDVGAKPFLQGLLLWLLISSISILVIIRFIH